MTDGLLILCLGLLVAAAGFKFHTVRAITQGRETYAELLRERQRLHDLRSEAQANVERLQLMERELTNDVRDLVRELSDLDSKIDRMTTDLSDEN